MRFNGAAVLVTGGLGFVGARVARALVAEGAAVTILDNGFNGSEQAVAGLPVTVVRGSVTDADLVADLVRPADLVFHMAAQSIIASAKDPATDFASNFTGTVNVLLALKDRPRDACRMVYTSSASVYGNARHIPTSEDDGFAVLSPYAAGKLCGEHYCQAFAESYGVRSAIVRYSNVYGPGQTNRNPYCGVIGKFIENALGGRPLLIHGDGEQTRDFTFVDDAVDATLLAALEPCAIGDVFNVGTGTECSINTLARLVLEATGAPVAIQHVERRDIDNIPRRAVHIEKARRRLRWAPRVRLAEGLRRTVEWYRQKDPQEGEVEA
ncbi:MAG TPA: NAD-dependent epimerase/dehydratase family protein [Symbiobacteriaceae bacterium]|nr:NAD-dependent epimerase/dehydratase family protein [Symbiobacteriaceae bacterium]